MAVRRGKTDIPPICGVCECCTPYKVPLPHGSGMYGGNIPRGAYVVRFFCSFDHQSARDSRGMATSINPREPAPLKSTGEPFCPKAKGFYDAKSTSISSFSVKSTKDPKATSSDDFDLEKFPIVEGYREIPALFFYKHVMDITEAGTRQKIRVVRPTGGVIATFEGEGEAA